MSYNRYEELNKYIFSGCDTATEGISLKYISKVNNIAIHASQIIKKTKLCVTFHTAS